MKNRFVLVAGAAAALVVVVAAGVLIVRRDSTPSPEEWAAEICSAVTASPLDEDAWSTLRDHLRADVVKLDLIEPIDGTEVFQAALVESRDGVAQQMGELARTDPAGTLYSLLDDLQQIAESQPDGPSADAVLTNFFGSIHHGEMSTLDAADQLPADSRAAIEAIPGCFDRLILK